MQILIREHVALHFFGIIRFELQQHRDDTRHRAADADPAFHALHFGSRFFQYGKAMFCQFGNAARRHHIEIACTAHRPERHTHRRAEIAAETDADFRAAAADIDDCRHQTVRLDRAQIAVTRFVDAADNTYRRTDEPGHLLRERFAVARLTQRIRADNAPPFDARFARFVDKFLNPRESTIFRRLIERLARCQAVAEPCCPNIFAQCGRLICNCFRDQ